MVCSRSDGAVVRVLLFGGARDACGGEGVEVPWRPGMALADILEDLMRAHAGLAPMRGHLRLARNGEFAALEDPVFGGDEVAVIPPVSGG